MKRRKSRRLSSDKVRSYISKKHAVLVTGVGLSVTGGKRKGKLARLARRAGNVLIFGSSASLVWPAGYAYGVSRGLFPDKDIEVKVRRIIRNAKKGERYRRTLVRRKRRRANGRES